MVLYRGEDLVGWFAVRAKTLIYKLKLRKWYNLLNFLAYDVWLTMDTVYIFRTGGFQHGRVFRTRIFYKFILYKQEVVNRNAKKISLTSIEDAYFVLKHQVLEHILLKE